jgi:UDP-sugar diphosphatase
LRRGDEELYHLVTDGYLLLFLPLVADLLPQLALVPKDAEGEPVPLDSLDELIIRHPDGRELKVWEAVMIYASAQASGQDGVPQIPGYYADTAGRITKVWTFPLLGWLLLIVAAVVGGIAYLLVRRRRRRVARDTGPAGAGANQAP